MFPGSSINWERFLCVLIYGKRIKISSRFISKMCRLRWLRGRGIVGIIWWFRNKIWWAFDLFILFRSKELTKLTRGSMKGPIMCFKKLQSKISSLKEGRLKIRKNSWRKGKVRMFWSKSLLNLGEVQNRWLFKTRKMPILEWFDMTIEY